MSDAANDGGGGRSTLIGGSAVASGSAMVAPDELPEQPANDNRRLPTSAIRDIDAPRKGVMSTEFVTRGAPFCQVICARCTMQRMLGFGRIMLVFAVLVTGCKRPSPAA